MVLGASRRMPPFLAIFMGEMLEACAWRIKPLGNWFFIVTIAIRAITQ
jgi:hypothetical protein